MANMFFARFDMTNAVRLDETHWFIEGQVYDTTGFYSSFDAQVGDIIYNDGTSMLLGPLRYKIEEIDFGVTDGIMFGAKVVWAIDNEVPQDPIPYEAGLIGKAAALDSSAIATYHMNETNEKLLADARNVETMRLATKLMYTQNQVGLLQSNKENKLGNPSVDGAFLTSKTTGQRIWRNVQPLTESDKGIVNGVATLNWEGKIPVQQLPAIAITDVHVVTNKTEMLALTAQSGDVAVVTGESKTYILKAEPAMLEDNWVALAATGGSGNTDTGTSLVSNEAKRIQPYRKGATYSIGEMVFHDGLLWVAKTGLFSVGDFDNTKWMLVAGNMDSYKYDSDGNGIIDRADHAEDARYAMFSDETRMIQPWRPNRQLIIGEQLIYANEFWIVKNNFTTSDNFEADMEHLEPLSLKVHSKMLELQGGNEATGEYYHLTDSIYQLVNRFADQSGYAYYNNRILGDMTRQVYDPDNDGIVEKAKLLDGVTVQNSQINYLQGVNENIQTQINRLSYGMNIKGSVPTRADLSTVPNPQKGDTIIILADEDYANKQTYYIYNGSTWLYLGEFRLEMRNFSIAPLNVVSETFGILPEARVDSLIARKADLHNHGNLSLLNSYTHSNAQISTAVTQAHEHVNLGLLETYNQSNTDLASAVTLKHEHTNKTILDMFSERADGKLLYKGALIEGTGSGGGTGITDLTSFTTNDLKDYADKRYVTDAQKASLAQLSTVISDQATLSNRVNDINAKIPNTASITNKLVTQQELAAKVGVTQYKQLTDVNPNLVANAFVVVNAAGNGLTYLNKIDMKIQKITDMDGNIFTNVEKLAFKELDASVNASGDLEFTIPKLKSLFTTDLKDMPTSFADNHGKLLVANELSMKYELKDIGQLTNSKANFSAIINQGDWTWDVTATKYAKIVEHNLNSKDLIVAFYDGTDAVKSLSYRILSTNDIMVYSVADEFAKIVVNCSQGAVGDGSGSGGGGITGVTASMFIDDTRVRLDKTYSSQQIMDTLNSYARKSNTYSRSEADARFATLDSQHIHSNLDVLTKFQVDALGAVQFNGKTLLTEIKGQTYKQNWNNVDNSGSLNTIVDSMAIFTAQGFSTILQSEFTIKNNIPSVDEITDAMAVNQLRLVVIDGAITLMNVLLKPQEVQKYVLGISPNIKILVQGKFDANYYVSAF